MTKNIYCELVEAGTLSGCGYFTMIVSGGVANAQPPAKSLHPVGMLKVVL